MLWPLLILPVKTEFLNLLLGFATYCINLDNIDLTDVFWMTYCLSVPKIMQIGSGILKMWAVKHSGPIFWPTL